MSSVVENPTIPLVENGGSPPKTYASNLSSQVDISPDAKLSCHSDVGYRLSCRKLLIQQKQRVALISMVTAMFGVAFMIIETEFTISLPAGHKGALVSLVFKVFMWLSTVGLLGFVSWYHVLELRLHMVDNCINDWRLAVDVPRVVRLALELAVCVIMPLPGDITVTVTAFDKDTGSPIQRQVHLDAFLSIPMFLRFYLVLRVLMLYNRLFTDARTQSLGALNRINFDFRFFFKSLMSAYPEMVLGIIMFSVLIIGGWAMRVCEQAHDAAHANLMNTLWLVAVTFLTVGYGDIVPQTYCGRTVAVLVGMFGAGCTALVVAVLARRLELSRMEKYVHNFVYDIDLEKRLKYTAAWIMKEGWYIYKARKRGNGKEAFKHQRHLHRAVQEMRTIKAEQRRMLDNAVTLVEMYMGQNQLTEHVQKISNQQKAIEESLGAIVRRLDSIEKKLQ